MESGVYLQEILKQLAVSSFINMNWLILQSGEKSNYDS